MEVVVERGPEKPPKVCGCCNHPILNIHGYVYRDGDARAVYYASWTPGHRERGIGFWVGLGEWGDGTADEHRTAFTLVYHHGPGETRGFHLEDASRFVREQAVFLGVPLDRAEALAHPLKAELFAICDVLLTEDHRIREFLSSLPAED